MYQTFFYTLIFVAVVLLHCGFIWRQARQERDNRPWTKGTKAVLVLLAASCAAAVIAGLVVVLARLDPTASHALGGVALLMAIWFDFRLGRACGK